MLGFASSSVTAITGAVAAVIVVHILIGFFVYIAWKEETSVDEHKQK